MRLPEEHRLETEKLLREQSRDNAGKKELGEWMLTEGYYPEPYVIPPCFKIENFNLSGSRKENKGYRSCKWSAYNFATISFPKTGLVQREFGIIHPKRYHDMVWEIIDNWDELLDKLFDCENEIYSYSFPLAISKDNRGKLRSGRMIYEFLEMAEKDLVAEAHDYKILAKVDITNFYNSIYTHTISWAWFGDRKKGLSDSGKFSSLGTKLDKLFQYSNDKRTNGLPVGPVISDLVVELILTERDKEISKRIKDRNIDYLATRFKDDYRILAKSKEDSDIIIKIIIEVLNNYNLQVNESKTKLENLPEGLFRKHALKYEIYSLKDKYPSKIPYKAFEYALLKTLEIHRDHLGTSLLEKFLSELTSKDKTIPIFDRLLIDFANEKIPNTNPYYEKIRRKNIKKTISLLLLLKNESTKCFGKVLSIIECLYLCPGNEWLREGVLFNILLNEFEQAIIKESAFELLWLLYFNDRHNFNIDINRIIKSLNKKGRINSNQSKIELLKNPFIATIRNKMPYIGPWCNPFGDKDISITMSSESSSLSDIYLIDYLDVFDRAEQENE